MEELRLSGNAASALRCYIGGLYSLESEDAFLRYAVPKAAGILGIDYHALILFPTLLMRNMLYESNNPEDFNREYSSHLNGMDPFMEWMINNGNRVAPLQKVLSPEERRRNVFYNECQKIRPAADGAYIPIIVDGVLRGFTGMVRAADNPRPLDRDELALLLFMTSFWPDAIKRIASKRGTHAGRALLSWQGDVLVAGDRICAVLKDVFGPCYYRRPSSHPGPAGCRFAKALAAVRDRDVLIRSARCDLDEKADAPALLLRRIESDGFIQYFPDQPQIEVDVIENLGPDIPIRNEAAAKFLLTERELSIVALVYQGWSNSDIAQKLKISPATVKHHIYNIYNKVGVDSRTQLIFALSAEA